MRCLRILVESGWKAQMSSELGKQLLILLTMIAGGLPNQTSSRPPTEELMISAFDCLDALFKALEGRAHATAIFDAVGTATIVDQVVYLLLQGVTDGSSDAAQVAAVEALRSLHARVTNRVLLASLLPRTISALTKSLRPTTQMRRSYRLQTSGLRLITDALRAVLNDKEVYAGIDTQKSKSKNEVPSNDNDALDESWLQATSSQVKLAIGQIIRLRAHDKAEVRNALCDLCLMVIEQCRKSLADSVQMAIETLIVLSEREQEDDHDASKALRHLVISDEQVRDCVQTSLHSWTTALPRVMQSSDDDVKNRALKQIATAYEVLAQTQSTSATIVASLADSICDSVALVVRGPQSNSVTISSSMQMLSLDDNRASTQFQPILLNQQSQKGTLEELQSLIAIVNIEDISQTMTKTMISRMYGSSGNELLASFWLALKSLKQDTTSVSSLDCFLDFDSDTSSRASLIEELYSFALPILLDLSSADPQEWQTPALALEAVALQASTLRKDFRPELIDALYPTLQLLGSSNQQLRSHAMTCLNILASACEYSDTSTLLLENVDYLVNAIALKLNTFELTPQAPQVLLMMIKLAGARLIPYLDDLVASIFAALDSFHGYPKLVELLFSVLGAIIDEGAKKPELLAITSGVEDVSITHRKKPEAALSITHLANMYAEKKRKREEKYQEDAYIDAEVIPHPKRPWTSKLDGQKSKTFDEEMQAIKRRDEAIEEDEDEPDPQSQPGPDPSSDPEKAISKSHSLLLHIAKSVPPHLASPSSTLRLSLLNLLVRAIPTLAKDENTFLPLVNDIWPSLTNRILPSPIDSRTTHRAYGARSQSQSLSILDKTKDEVISAETDSSTETIVAAEACLTVETMIRNAGDFMSSRVETESRAWLSLYNKLWIQVSADLDKRSLRRAAATATPSPSTTLTKQTPTQSQSYFIKNTPSHRLWASLASLLSSLPQYTRLNITLGNTIAEALSPILALNKDHLSADTDLALLKTNVQSALGIWNQEMRDMLVEREVLRRKWRLTGGNIASTSTSMSSATGQARTKSSSKIEYPRLEWNKLDTPVATEEDISRYLGDDVDESLESGGEMLQNYVESLRQQRLEGDTYERVRDPTSRLRGWMVSGSGEDDWMKFPGVVF